MYISGQFEEFFESENIEIPFFLKKQVGKVIHGFESIMDESFLIFFGRCRKGATHDNYFYFVKSMADNDVLFQAVEDLQVGVIVIAHPPHRCWLVSGIGLRNITPGAVDSTRTKSAFSMGAFARGGHDRNGRNTGDGANGFSEEFFLEKI